jgi:biotin transport system substrate-specific component
VLLVIAGAALVGLAAQVSLGVPLLSPTSFTLQSIMVLTVAAGLGAVRGMAAMALYAGLALLGLPWLAGANSAFNVDGQIVAGFGYNLGFILAAGAVGYLAERGWTRTFLDSALAFMLGSVIIHAVGVTWLYAATDTTWATAIYSGMTVFLLVDAIKILIVSALFPIVWKQLTKAGLAHAINATAPEPSRTSPVQDSERKSDEEFSQEASTTNTDISLEEPELEEISEVSLSVDDDESVIDLTDLEKGSSLAGTQANERTKD